MKSSNSICNFFLDVCTFSECTLDDRRLRPTFFENFLDRANFYSLKYSLPTPFSYKTLKISMVLIISDATALMI